MDFCEGLLGHNDAELIAAHLASGCGHCAENRRWYEHVRGIAAGNISAEPAPWVLKRAVGLFDREHARLTAIDSLGRLVASLVFDTQSQPALSGARAAELSDRQLLYRAGHYSIDLQIALCDQRMADLTGQILRENDSRFESVAEIPLELIREGEKVCSTVTDEIGKFKITTINRGEYEMLIDTREGIISVPRLSITPP
jgi:hypothetical protein